MPSWAWTRWPHPTINNAALGEWAKSLDRSSLARINRFNVDFPERSLVSPVCVAISNRGQVVGHLLLGPLVGAEAPVAVPQVVAEFVCDQPRNHQPEVAHHLALARTAQRGA